MELGLKGARVVVTGGASNIGRGIAHGFAEEGCRVAVVDLDGDQAARVGREVLDLGAQGSLEVVEDLAAEGGGRRAIERVLDEWDGVDVLVNNAGISVPGFLTETTDRQMWERTMAVNLFAGIECTQAVLGPMGDAGEGAIVHISSDAAFGVIRQGVYGSSKAAQIALARTIAREHGRNGVRSNIVAPGLVLPEGSDAVGATSLWSAGSGWSEDQIASVVDRQPLRRRTTARDVARAVVWVASPVAARQVTGQVIAVGGGSSMP
ncbi:SDR family NAD(P)-dependent oxidoreductase [Nitriliruptor alkaliphilus]|uniref:SDR family NAD(P)-dependent oxidoreductase n=1 Tax=Nitriliruptor alkaliphilus TaxID=427918 RepID=UPI000695F018|nr:SDR family oxidoreductase [Nitriliruptor alkaliphilus]